MGCSKWYGQPNGILYGDAKCGILLVFYFMGAAFVGADIETLHGTYTMCVSVRVHAYYVCFCSCSRVLLVDGFHHS